jgi:hypothetical protein
MSARPCPTRYDSRMPRQQSVHTRSITHSVTHVTRHGITRHGMYTWHCSSPRAKTRRRIHYALYSTPGTVEFSTVDCMAFCCPPAALLLPSCCHRTAIVLPSYCHLAAYPPLPDLPTCPLYHPPLAHPLQVRLPAIQHAGRLIPKLPNSICASPAPSCPRLARRRVTIGSGSDASVVPARTRILSTSVGWVEACRY